MYPSTTNQRVVIEKNNYKNIQKNYYVITNSFLKTYTYRQTIETFKHDQ